MVQQSGKPPPREAAPIGASERRSHPSAGGAVVYWTIPVATVAHAGDTHSTRGGAAPPATPSREPLPGPHTGQVLPTGS